MRKSLKKDYLKNKKNKLITNKCIKEKCVIVIKNVAGITCQ